ncbi:MurR/RpiR family transcriptional regulator [Methylobrevis pamukkalensis]|uniref:Putative DNA-binding transcriptional regulator n=1 Tax=Methylobrevis pamukkalensis TaxID=1439726 RepID=A0A1E3GYG0_9HYPH|nr:MurR/RpiR family transcriptional regulator [Methylobrevis pamukkalensis]ODN69083.1 putative DNA-binding transcriptional regulator [Methylobrevis pamukkalensis]
MQGDKSFLGRVNQALPTLHPAERKLGNMLCDFPGDLASYSSGELAALAGVSKATISRFVRKLGYVSFEEARRHAREEKATGSRLYLASRTLADARTSLDTQFARTVENLQRTLSTIDDTTIPAIADALLSARKVWVVGYRASHAFASYVGWQLLQVLETISVIPGGGQTMGEHLVGVGAADVVLVFGLRRRPVSLGLVLDQIEQSGARLVYITDEGAPPHSGVSWHLRCETSPSGPLFNHVSVMAICHLITDETIARAGSAGRARLRGIETLNDALEEL